METKQFVYLCCSAISCVIGIALCLTFMAKVIVYHDPQMSTEMLFIGAIFLGAALHFFGNFLHEMVKNRNKAKD